MIQLAAFLGNPGRGYAGNRHNAGRMLAKALPFYASLSWQKKFKGLYASHDGKHFLLPETYMNVSGESVLSAAVFFKIKIEEIIVVHDELELPLGTISLKFSGGLGGHNGLRSMKKCFGSADFWRLRIGIGRPVPQTPDGQGSEDRIYDWVLSDFSKTEQETLYPALEAGAGLLQKVFANDPETLLDEWKKKKVQLLPEQI
ncbi:MAG: aminoacyl-tRNA hydrolase [Treponema sp.]|jgi:PTH1 family peptidyl-tRNA hydrolase|nr:aminoacyl-tRNA hydrolase [Treponema sp.]